MADQYGFGRVFHTDFVVVYPPQDSGSRRKFGVKLDSPVQISDYHSGRVTAKGRVQFSNGWGADDIEMTYDTSFDQDSGAWLIVRLSDLKIMR